MTNLSTEAKAELQRMIDIGATHMREQGCCSMNGTICAYRGANDSKCFIGSLISDKHYTDCLEGIPVIWDSKPTPVLEALESSGYKLDAETGEALDAAQWLLHDNIDNFSTTFPAAFEAALVSYCSEYELDYTAPGETL
jgi:hypothetical protein